MFSILDQSMVNLCLKGRDIDDTTCLGPFKRAAVGHNFRASGTEDYSCTIMLTFAMDLTTFKKAMNDCNPGVLYMAEQHDKITTKFLKGKEIFYKNLCVMPGFNSLSHCYFNLFQLSSVLF